MTLREINQKIEEKKIEEIEHRNICFNIQKEVKQLRKQLTDIQIEALFEYLPIGTEYRFKTFSRISGIRYSAGDRVIFFRKNPKSILLKWISVRSKPESSTVRVTADYTTHRVPIDTFFEMVMLQSDEFSEGFRKYLNRKATLEEIGI